jgi:hypothetical protein
MSLPTCAAVTWEAVKGDEELTPGVQSEVSNIIGTGIMMDLLGVG